MSSSVQFSVAMIFHPTSETSSSLYCALQRLHGFLLKAVLIVSLTAVHGQFTVACVSRTMAKARLLLKLS